VTFWRATTHTLMTLVPRSKQWKIAPQAPADFVQELGSFGPLVAQVLYNRGLTDRTKVSH
jgi:hypothetical protein